MLSPQMVSGVHLGRFLSLVSKMVRPTSILEIGTFTGYASFCLLEGLGESGKMVTIEANPETRWLFEKYKSLIDKKGQIERIEGNALEWVPKMDIHPDLVWIDAGKKDNQRFVEMILPKMNKGGVLMIDNTLWSGKVLHEQKDEHTESIHAFNGYLSTHENLQTFFVPIRDGVTVCLIK